MKKLVIILLCLGISCQAMAHQPRYVFKQGDVNNPIIVEKPEISKAYYGKLEGQPNYYKIRNDKDFNLYLNILAADVKTSRTDFKVEVIKDSETVFVLDGEKWDRFYEPFGGDSYLRGPELEKQVTGGTYYIKVSNPDNQGRYCLAVGNIESFPPGEIVNTYLVLPRIKKDFFDKSPLSAFFNLVGLFLLIIIVFILVILLLIFYFVKRITRLKNQKLVAKNN